MMVAWAETQRKTRAGLRPDEVIRRLDVIAGVTGRSGDPLEDPGAPYCASTP